MLSNVNHESLLYHYFYHLLSPALTVAKTLAQASGDTKLDLIPDQISNLGNTMGAWVGGMNVKDDGVSGAAVAATIPSKLKKPIYLALCRLATIINQDYPAALSEFSTVFATDAIVPLVLPQLRSILLSPPPLTALIPPTLSSYATLHSLTHLQSHPNLLRTIGLSPLLPPIDMLLLDYPLELLVENPSHKEIIQRFTPRYQQTLYQSTLEYFSSVHMAQQQQLKAYHHQQQPGGIMPPQSTPIPPFPQVILQ